MAYDNLIISEETKNRFLSEYRSLLSEYKKHKKELDKPLNASAASQPINQNRMGCWFYA